MGFGFLETAINFFCRAGSVGRGMKINRAIEHATMFGQNQNWERSDQPKDSLQKG
jgi:hypothetical protein